MGLVLGTLVAPPGRAQTSITIIDTVPPGIRLFSQGQFTLQYTAVGDAPTNGIQVDFFRDDAMGQVTVAIPDPSNPPPPFMVVLPLKTNVDRVANTFTAVVRDVLTNNIDLAGPFTVFSDDVGPDPPVISSPVFPVTTFNTILRIDGTFPNTQAGGATMPETAGQVVVRRASDMLVLGGGQITTSSSFIALADLTPLILNTPTPIEIFGIDSVGNAGTTLTVQVTVMMAMAPTIVATLEPPDGTVTRDPGVAIRGTISGAVSPLTVNVFVDGLLASQITGLSSNQNFLHTVNLPSEGTHIISVQGVNGNAPPMAGLAQNLGSITLDRTAPMAPVILQPDPGLGTLITNMASFVLEGFTTERDVSTTDTSIPEIRLQGPPGIQFTPPPPLAIDPMTGRFMTTVDISALPDGNYFLDVIVVDEAGNSDSSSTGRVTFTKDTEVPQVDRVLVNGRLAPSVDPEVYVGQISVPIQVTYTEPMRTPPDLFVTQLGGTQTPTGRSTVTTRTVTYVHGVVPGFDGPVQVDITGGADRAGNSVNATLARLFVVDTTPPNVVSIEPADMTTVATSPPRIRVRLEDPPSPQGTFSGVDLLLSTVIVEGPIGSASATIAGTLTPFDPFTVDFVPLAPIQQEGTYRVRVVPQDKVGNRAVQTVQTFILDRTPLMLDDRNVVTDPPRSACRTAASMPGGLAAPFVEVTVRDPSFDAVASRLVVRDFCRVPPEVPGSKVIVDANTLRYQFSQPFAADGSQDGVYAIQLDAFDLAGNASPTFTTTYTLDNLSPSVVATFPTSTTAVNGPLRIVDATLLDATRDFCRKPGGIDRNMSTLALTLVTPNPATNTTPAGTQVQGTLRFVSQGPLDRILLEIADSAGFPSGLRLGGLDDGLYRLSTEAFDCATNTSGMTISTFVYDTLRPLLEVDDVRDGGTITGPDFTMMGRLTDDQNGSGVSAVTVTLESVDANGTPTTSPFFLNAPAVLDPTPLGAPQPTAAWTFVGDLRRVPTGTRARLRVRGFDRAGNFDERIFTVTAMASTIPPPRLSTPASGASTSSQILAFTWEPQPQAARYRLRIQTPNGDVILRETVGTETRLDVNLTGIPDPEGRFLWAVASLDDVGGAGAFSQNRPFFVDRGKPRVVTVDIVDPSPEAVGSINEGLVRITIRFSEPMDTTRAPNVRIQPQNPGTPPIPVVQLSYDGDTWQGEATIREASELVKDPNGIAQIRITGAFDTGGNENLEPQGGITLFEIDTGPFWRVAVFKNPIDDQDVVLVVKGFKRDGGLAEDIVGLPSVFVQRQGQADQVPVVKRISQSAFHGSFRLDRRTLGEVAITVSGSDQDGNTSTRRILLSIRRLSPNEEIRIQASGMSVAVGAGAVRAEHLVTTLSAATALQPEAPGGELELVGGLPQVGPVGLELEHPAQVEVDRAELPDDLRGLGVFRKDSAGLVLLPGTVDEAGARVRTSKLGPMVLLRDRTPPSLGAPQMAWRGGRLEFEIPATDAGAGLDPEASSLRIGSRRIRLRHDAVRGLLVASLGAPEASQGEAVGVTGADRLGNLSTSVQGVVPPPTFGFSEVQPYPNPARHECTVRYRLNQAAEAVVLDLFDTSGRRVARLRGPGGAGVQALRWDLRSTRGKVVANGVYLGELTATGPGGRARERIKIAVVR